MHTQPTLVVNIDTTALARLIGKRKWDKAFKDMCEAAEQRASQDTLDKMRSEIPRVLQEQVERSAREYTKPDGTFEGSIAIEFTERWAQYKQERFDFYLKLMIDLVKAEMESSSGKR